MTDAHTLLHVKGSVARCLRSGPDDPGIAGHTRMMGHNFNCDVCKTSVGLYYYSCGHKSEVCAHCEPCDRCEKPQAKTIVGPSDIARLVEFAGMPAACSDVPSEAEWVATAASLIAQLHTGFEDDDWTALAVFVLNKFLRVPLPEPLVIENAEELRPGCYMFFERTAQFMISWRRRVPILVRRCRVDRERWDPRRLQSEFTGDLPVQTPGGDDAGTMTSADFFRRVFAEGCAFELRDWPRDATFAKRMPGMSEDFYAAFPPKSIPAMMFRPDGELNLRVDCKRFHTIQPDMGPKVYAGSGQTYTWVHKDIGDAVNVLMHVQEGDASGGGGDAVGAVWHLWSHTSRARLTESLRDIHRRTSPLDDLDDPFWVGDRERYHPVFVEDGDLAKVAPTWTIEQRRGDAVFVPCGCPHQVRNVRGCFKIASDFVSPEAVDQFRVCREELQAIREYEKAKSELVILSSALRCLALLDDKLHKQAEMA